MMCQNPFRESMSYPEARDTLFLEIRKTTDKSRVDRLKADYAAVIPFITKRELDAGGGRSDQLSGVRGDSDMYWNPFNENMSSLEAQTVLFSMGDKTTDKREREQIKADYAKVLRVIMSRELRDNQYILTSEPV